MRELILTILLVPLFALYRVRLFSYETISQCLAFVPGLLGIGIRRVWYRRTLAACGTRLVVDFLSAIRTPLTQVGDHCYIGRDNWIGWAEIGDGLLSGNGVTIHSGPHQHGFARLDVPMRLQPGSHRQVKIGPDVWLGAHVVVNADVAQGSIVASGAVVTKTFPAYSIIGGVPARLIRTRTSEAPMQGTTSEEA